MTIDTLEYTKIAISKIEARLNLLTWMVGFNLAATMAVLWKLLVVR